MDARAGPHNAITDVPGVRVGHDTQGATGVTVVLVPPQGAVCGVDVRGAAPATRETDLLAPTHLVECAHAVLLCGGSAFGLAAADGVMAWLEARGAGFDVAPGRVVPIVPAAALFDLGRGGDWQARPTADSGRRACAAAADGPVAQGNVGAGAGALAGSLKGGVGTASVDLGPCVWVGALVAVNAYGSAVDPATGRLHAAAWGLPGEFDGLRPHPGEAPAPAPARPLGHTTLAVVATNARLSRPQATRVAQMAHDGLARAIRPIHTMFDGDAVFALSTGEAELDVVAELPFGTREALQTTALGAAAADALARAVGHALLHAEAACGAPSYRGRHLE